MHVDLTKLTLDINNFFLNIIKLIQIILLVINERTCRVGIGMN